MIRLLPQIKASLNNSLPLIIEIFSRTQWGIERMISDSIAVVEYYVIKKPIEFVSNLFNEYNELKSDIGFSVVNN